MYLKSLKIENFRCFDEVEIDFDLPGANNRKWTVIVGENGDGKTTILQCLALAMAGHQAIWSLLPNVDALIRVGKKQAKITVNYENSSGEGNTSQIVLKRGDTAEKASKRSLETANHLNRALGHAKRNYLALAYGTSRRRSTDQERTDAVMKNYPLPRARSMASLFSREVPLQPLEQWVTSLVMDDQQNIAGIVTDLVAEFLPEIAFESIEADGTILFKTRDGIIPLHQLSNGFQSLIAFMGDLLFQITNIFSNYKNPLNARGLLLIDSVGADLHPKLQRRLLEFLDTRLPRLQLVVTTQSIIVAQQSPKDALHYCIRGENGVEVLAFDGEPRKLRLNQLMMTEAFGDTTYESLEVEEMKERYRELDDRGKLSAAEKREMGRIKAHMVDMPVDDTALAMSTEQAALLADVRSLLEEAKK